MVFDNLLQQVGGVRRFQHIKVTLVVLSMLLMASHNTLPPLHCPPTGTTLSQWHRSHNGTRATEPCISGYIYDHSIFPPIIMTVMRRPGLPTSLPTPIQSIFMAGILVASLMFGTSPDRSVLIWTHLQLAVSGACAAFTPNFPAYCACRFLSGMAMS
ncbi:S22A6 protein, partial [Crocuta crocuta]